jgi:hypothetical protein
MRSDGQENQREMLEFVPITSVLLIAAAAVLDEVLAFRAWRRKLQVVRAQYQQRILGTAASRLITGKGGVADSRT